MMRLTALLAVGSLATVSVAEDPSLYRMVVTSNSIYSLEPMNFETGSGEEVVMRYDLEEDPREENAVNGWIGGRDIYGKTAYDYTRWDGPLGINGPLGRKGPLSQYGALPTRYIGDMPVNLSRTYMNNWCDVPLDESDKECVYGSYGPIGVSGAINDHAYYHDMYHLQERVFWYNNYNHNLDASGVWGIQGPAGPTGPLGVLGALGPLGVSLQFGMTTTSDGIYESADAPLSASPDAARMVVRKTQPIRYEHDAIANPVSRIYDLYEMYSREYALSMPPAPPQCSVNASSYNCMNINDCSFAVDAAEALSLSSVISDSFNFLSSFSQFVHVNLVPVTATMTTSGDDLENGSGAAKKDSIDINLQLLCSQLQSDTYAEVARASASFTTSGRQNFLVPYITTRLRESESCELKVNISADISAWTGYYLYVTGSGFSSVENEEVNDDPDWLGPRKQLDGSHTFNIVGPHQSWSEF